MEQCKHNFLVGDGALQFAKDKGFRPEDNSVLLGESTQDAYKVFLNCFIFNKQLLTYS